jgi:NADH dehydrogenase
VAGALAELARFVLARDFRAIRPEQARVVLLEANDRLLSGAFHPSLARRAQRQLEELGVEVRVGARVSAIDEHGVRLADGELLDAPTILWTAGVRARPLVGRLGVATDRGGRVVVEPDCSIPGHPEVFVIGDAACFVPPGDSRPLPGVAPVAMQQARSVAANLERALRGQARVPFRYRDKGMLATVGRSRAVAESGRVRLGGLLAWLAWLVVHIWFLVGFRNRFVVMFTWAWSYFTYKRGARLITGEWRSIRRPGTEE